LGEGRGGGERGFEDIINKQTSMNNSDLRVKKNSYDIYIRSFTAGQRGNSHTMCIYMVKYCNIFHQCGGAFSACMMWSSPSKCQRRVNDEVVIEMAPEGIFGPVKIEEYHIIMVCDDAVSLEECLHRPFDEYSGLTKIESKHNTRKTCNFTNTPTNTGSFKFV
jgi:hypothetical protein